MKKSYLGLIVLCILLTVVAIVIAEKQYRIKEDYKIRLDAAQMENDIVSPGSVIILPPVKDIFGREHITLRDVESSVTRDEFDMIAVTKGSVDTTKLYIDKLKGEITRLTSIAARSKGRALKAEKLIDSLGNLSYSYDGPFISLGFRPPTDSLGIGRFNYNYLISGDITQYKTQKKFLGIPYGKVEHFTDIHLRDTNARFESARIYTIKEQPPSKFGFKLQALGSYAMESGDIGTGFEANARYNRFHFFGARTYYPRTDMWRSRVGGKFDLIKIGDQ